MTADSRAEQKPVLAALPRITGQLNRIFTILLLGGLAVWLLVNFVKAPDQFLSVTLVGITQGAIYALVALGYTLVYGIIELINFAHGDVFMWGTMITVTVAGTHLGLDGSQSGAGHRRRAAADAVRGDGVLRGAEHGHRVRRLQTPEKRAQTGAADLGDRRVLHPVGRGVGPVLRVQLHRRRRHHADARRCSISVACRTG